MGKVSFASGIGLQPEVLAGGREGLLATVASLTRYVQRGQTVGLIGIGASYCAASSAEQVFRCLGTRAVAIDAGQLYGTPPPALADIYVAVSASGRSLETIQVLDQLKRPGGPFLIGLTAEADNVMSEIVDFSIVCGAYDDSTPATTSYLASLQALAFLAVLWSGGDLQVAGREWGVLSDILGDHAHRCRLAVEDLAGPLASATSVDFVADGRSLGAAAEGALLLREAAQLPAACFGSRFYLHGPMEALEHGRGVVVLGGATDEANGVVIAQANALGCPVVAVTSGAPAATERHVRLPRHPGALVTSALEVVALQVLACRCSQLLGHTSGKFRYPQPQVKLSTRPDAGALPPPNH